MAARVLAAVALLGAVQVVASLPLADQHQEPVARDEAATGQPVQVPSLLLMSGRELSVAQLPLIDNGKTSSLFRLADLERSVTDEQMRTGSLGTRAEWQQIARSTSAEVEVEEDARGGPVAAPAAPAGQPRRPRSSSQQPALSLNVTSAASSADWLHSGPEEERAEAQLSDLDVHGRLACAFVADTAGRVYRVQLDQRPAEERGAPTSGPPPPPASAHYLTPGPLKSRLVWTRAGWLAQQRQGQQRQSGLLNQDEQPRANSGEQQRPTAAASGRANEQTKLALDWANNLLFVLTGDTLLALELDGRNQLTLIDDFGPNSRPLDIKVEPAGNFLFWLTPGQFHNTIYRLDLGALLEHKPPGSLVERATKQVALLSHRLAQPIIGNLPKHSTLFVIDHKHSRIYVPFAPNLSVSDDDFEALLGTSKPVDAEVFAPGAGDSQPPVTHMNATGGAAEPNCTLDSSAPPADGLILAYNLDGTDQGPLRTLAEKANLAGLAGMRDLALDQRNNFLYWLTASGSEIFEEYKVDKDDKFYSAIHSLDGGQAYARLVHYDPANQPLVGATGSSTENQSSVRTLLDTLAGLSTANRWVRSGSQELVDEPASGNSMQPLTILALAVFAVACVAIVFQRSFGRQGRASAKQRQPDSLASATPTITERTTPYAVESDAYYGAEFSSLVKLSSWPANLDYLGNKLYVPSEFQQDEALNAITRISIDQLAIERKSTPLGEGHFGTVMRGVLTCRQADTSGPQPSEHQHDHEHQDDDDGDGYLTPTQERTFEVAIKKLKENASQDEKRDFLQEAKLLANFEHPNIVKLIGICLDRGSTLIIMELMLGGDLTRYMKECMDSEGADDERLTADDLLAICIDIASGCCYLERLNFIHRDLAARNCLVSSKRRQERVVKLADFGLARDIYKDSYYKKLNDSAMPLKWMAPECLFEQKFTTKSDVWSFGVVMWEVMSYCQDKPYASVAPTFMRDYLAGGERLAKPKSCTDQMYELMSRCWKLDPIERPSFKECKSILVELREEEQNFI